MVWFSKQWSLHEEREKQKALHCKDALLIEQNLHEVNAAAASLVSFPCARTGQQNVPAITIPPKNTLNTLQIFKYQELFILQ